MLEEEAPVLVQVRTPESGTLIWPSAGKTTAGFADGQFPLVAVAELFEEFGSGVVDVTVAVLLIVVAPFETENVT